MTTTQLSAGIASKRKLRRFMVSELAKINGKINDLQGTARKIEELIAKLRGEISLMERERDELLDGKKPCNKCFGQGMLDRDCGTFICQHCNGRGTVKG